MNTVMSDTHQSETLEKQDRGSKDPKLTRERYVLPPKSLNAFIKTSSLLCQAGITQERNADA